MFSEGNDRGGVRVMFWLVNSPDCATRCQRKGMPPSGMFRSIQWNVPIHTMECSDPYSGMFRSTQWNVPIHHIGKEITVNNTETVILCLIPIGENIFCHIHIFTLQNVTPRACRQNYLIIIFINTYKWDLLSFHFTDDYFSTLIRSFSLFFITFLLVFRWYILYPNL